MSDSLVIAGQALSSRLLMGSAGYPNQRVMLEPLTASGAEVVTMAIRRVSLEAYPESLLHKLREHYRLLPNTSGCATIRDALLTAELAREALETNWIKLELIGDRETLNPDVEQLVQAAARLVRTGFPVLPYCKDVPVTCRKLADVGCAAVMPLGSPIGSGMGLTNPYAVELICNRSSVPVILDAGIGTASDAALAMELGCAGVLLNSAVAKAQDPVRMALAMRAAAGAGGGAGFSARGGGRLPGGRYAGAARRRLGVTGWWGAGLARRCC